MRYGVGDRLRECIIDILVLLGDAILDPVFAFVVFLYFYFTFRLRLFEISLKNQKYVSKRRRVKLRM